MSFVKHIFNRESPDQIQIEDVKKLIESETEESLHLDYEEIPRKNVQYDGLATHISGFLNTSGGAVIFGVSERTTKGRNIPYRITWTMIKKETIENNLYQKIDPWYEEIQICPIQNPNDPAQRIFVIFVPKSKNAPHMANHIYYIRINFQTQPLGHEQLSAIFRQNYFQKYDLVKNIYGPLFNEMVSNYDKTRIEKWDTREYNEIRKNKHYFWAGQDLDFQLELEHYYRKVSEWNKALDVVSFRMSKIINNLGSEMFKKQATPAQPDSSAMTIEIRAESTHQFVHVDEAILNREDPIKFWKVNYPFDKISEIKYHFRYSYDVGRETTMIIEEKIFKQFMKRLKKEVEKDKLILYIWKEHDELQSRTEYFMDALEEKMQ